MYVSRALRTLTLVHTENDALLAKHANDLLVEFAAPDIVIRFSQEQLVYVSYQNQKHLLKGCNLLFYGSFMAVLSVST